MADQKVEKALHLIALLADAISRDPNVQENTRVWARNVAVDAATEQTTEKGAENAS